MKAGLLLPYSNLRPLLIKELVDGLKKAFEIENTEVEFFNEHIGLGADQQKILQASQSLVLYHDVDVIFAMVGHEEIETLASVVSKFNKDLVILDLGAKLSVYNALGDSGRGSIYSYGTWESALQLGVHTGEKVGKKAFVAGSMLNSGYPITWAFSCGLEVGKGEIVGYYLLNSETGETDYSGIISKAVEAKADVIFALFEPEELSNLLRIRDESGHGDLHIVSPGILAGSIDNFGNFHCTEPSLPEDKLPDLSPLTRWACYSALDYLSGNRQHRHTQPLPLITTSFEIRNGEVGISRIPGSVKHETFTELLAKGKQSEQSGWTNPYLCI